MQDMPKYLHNEINLPFQSSTKGVVIHLPTLPGMLCDLCLTPSLPVGKNHGWIEGCCKLVVFLSALRVSCFWGFLALSSVLFGVSLVSQDGMLKIIYCQIIEPCDI